MLVDADRAGMRTIAERVRAGKPHATIAGTFPLAGAAEAHRLGDTGRTTGKLVLMIRQKVSTGLMVLPEVMSWTAWPMSSKA